MVLTAHSARYFKDLDVLDSNDELDAFCENVLALPFVSQEKLREWVAGGGQRTQQRQ